MAATRRLAAILAADAVGYSRLMRADEEGTHERFKAHRRELVDPKIREHHGRIVKFTGDGMLAEFPSVVEAVLCAIEVQCGMTRRNLGVADDERISFRIGVNVGDVIAEPEDIYGDGVNIAARLEALAEPNGICISQTVYEQVRDKLPYPFEDLGHQNVKNIARPLHAFVLRPAVIAALPLSDTVPLRHEGTSGPLPGRPVHPARAEERHGTAARTGRPLDERDEVVTALGGPPPRKDRVPRHNAIMPEAPGAWPVSGLRRAP